MHLKNKFASAIKTLLQENITIDELLRRTYSNLSTKLPNQELTLAEPLYLEIADDSDDHRIRKGYMEYKKANIIETSGKTWLIGLGKAYGSYPSKCYNHDILTIELPNKQEFINELKSWAKEGEYHFKSQTGERFVEEIWRSFYFRNSIIYGMDNGSLNARVKSRTGMKLMEALKEMQKNGIIKKNKLEFIENESKISIPSKEYNPKFSIILAEVIGGVLERNHRG